VRLTEKILTPDTTTDYAKFTLGGEAHAAELEAPHA
jgi:hypothetical protein